MADSASDKQQDPQLQEKMDSARNAVPTEFLPGLASIDPRACNAFMEKEEPNLYADLFNIVKKLSGALLYARRMQIRRAGEAELYDLGKQLIVWDDDGTSWIGASSTGQFLPAYDERVEEEDWVINFYKAYGQAFQTTASENVPPIPFIPVGSSREDLDAAKHATLASALIARNNDAPQLMADYAYHGFTGGLMATYTRTVTDGNAFGWKTNENGELVLDDKGRKIPNSQVVISTHGALDCTLPETGNCQREWDHMAFHLDIPRSRGFATYPWLTDISPGGNVTDDDILSRLFRVAVRANVPPRMPSEALDNINTLVRIWLKPSTFFQDPSLSLERRNAMLTKFPEGVCMHYLGGSFCAAIPEHMDKRWNIEFSSAGRGTRRPGWGDAYIPLQDQCNILSSLYHDYIVHGAPTIFHIDKVVNREAIQRMESRPFQFVPMTNQAQPQMDVTKMFYATPEVDVPPSLIQRLNDITVGTVGQFITGIAPALTGVGLEGVVQETARGFEQQIEKSQGKIALFYRRIRSLHWKTMYTAVKEFAESTDQPTAIAAPGKKAQTIDPVAIKKGNFCIYPEADEGRPVLFRDKREQLAALLTNPAMAPSTTDIDNLDFVRRVLGQPEWCIEGKGAWDKQAREIDELLSVGQEGDGEIPPQMLPELMATFPTIKPGPLDDHVTELKRCQKFYNSEEGWDAQNTNPLGWANFLAHAEAHKQAIPPQPNPAEKPVSETMAWDKMPPEAQVQKLKQLGIETTPESVAATMAQLHPQKPEPMPAAPKAPEPPKGPSETIPWDKMPADALVQKLAELGIQTTAESIEAAREKAKPKPVAPSNGGKNGHTKPV